MRALILFLAVAAFAGEYERRVDVVRKTPGFVALWDFVKRSDGRFDAWQAPGDRADLRLDAVNYVGDYWGEGRAATYADFPLLGQGPFGQAVEIRDETDRTFRPLLLVPRKRFHNSPLDVKGPGRSVSMVVWLIRKSGNHAIAGIWHEGTDLIMNGKPVPRSERGKRQYALFAGLGANNGASAVHVSENGASSFGDKYARNLAVTPELIEPGIWTAVGFVFDNARNKVTAYINGKATEYWIDDPQKHPFFKWPAGAWPDSYRPPRAFTKIRNGQLTALKVNPFWFDHDLYRPERPEDGGPFTIGRVIHTSRSVGFTGWIGGVAVFSRPLSPKQMRRLSTLTNPTIPIDLVQGASLN